MTFFHKATGFIVSLLMLFIIVATSLIFFPVSLVLWLVTIPFDKKRVVLHRYTCFCLGFWAYIMPFWRIKVEGREKIKKDTRYVIVANHQSQLDILMTAMLFSHFKWVSKAEILKIPILGWQMALNKYITIKRGYVNSIAKMMNDCEDALKTGSSVLLFPEGARSETGEIQTFRPGAFILAENQQVPVLPVVIYGTKDALPKRTLFSFGIHNIVIKVLDETPVSQMSGFSPEENAAATKELIAKHYNLIAKRFELDLY